MHEDVSPSRHPSSPKSSSPARSRARTSTRSWVCAATSMEGVLVIEPRLYGRREQMLGYGETRWEVRLGAIAGRAHQQGDGAQSAIDVGDGIFMSKNIANSYLVTSRRRLLINTGTDFEAPDQATLRRDQRVRCASSFTQGHPDHVGGWDCFDGDGVETIAQANHPDVREYWRNLHPFYVRRICPLCGDFMDVEAIAAELPPEPVLTTSFIDSHSFEVGGRRFELYSTPGGETTDALVVWMPEHGPYSSETCSGRSSGTYRTCTRCAATRSAARSPVSTRWTASSI